MESQPQVYFCTAEYILTQGIGWNPEDSTQTETYLLEVDRRKQKFKLNVGEGDSETEVHGEIFDYEIEGSSYTDFVNNVALKKGSSYFKLSDYLVTWNKERNLPEITDRHDWCPYSEQRELKKNIERVLMLPRNAE
ncbi:hypothetical protein CYMTET_13666 [Cymbomonas tetramitiformis]|uniref:Uncharacterized protein n=1 Tax=Cymbomonas tetramitiformis TaxID=36881 RepID=A0AAE0GI55_9CHLO|nr:hypothetical protein CYMTET_13666 [Cymbomonas tetramitiformis]